MYKYLFPDTFVGDCSWVLRLMSKQRWQIRDGVGWKVKYKVGE